MKKSEYLLSVIIALIVLLFSIDSSSIWIDEMLTYEVVHTNSFPEMLKDIFTSHSANGGMPLYFIFEWIWTRFAGYDEIGLRSLNIPFAIIYLITSWYIIRKIKTFSWFCILFFLHPLFIYYMNEARPYVLLLAAGNIYTYLLFFRDLNDYKTLFWLYFIFLVGLFTHMMFGFIILMYVVQCIRLLQAKELNIKKHLSVLSIFALPYLALLCYYLNVMKGAGEIGGGDILPPDWKASLMQIGYYFTGFGGLSLSRNDLRAMMLSQLSWEHIVWMTLLVIGYLISGLYIFKNKLWNNKKIISIFISAIVAAGSFFIVNILFQTRFWERHIIYLLPVWLLLLCYILKLMFTSGKLIYQVGTLLIVGITMLSGLRTMFDDYYKKEDYKGICTYIKETEGSFFLQGDSAIYSYYGVNPESSNIQLINNIQKEELAVAAMQQILPLFLILSIRKEFDQGKLFYLSYEGQDTRYNSFRIVRYTP